MLLIFKAKAAMQDLYLKKTVKNWYFYLNEKLNDQRFNKTRHSMWSCNSRSINQLLTIELIPRFELANC